MQLFKYDIMKKVLPLIQLLILLILQEFPLIWKVYKNLIKKNEDKCDEIILPNDAILNNKDLNMIEKENDLFETQINEESGLDNKIY